MPEALRHHVRNCSMQTLGTEPGKSTAARVIAAVASIEVPKGMWSTVASDLLAHIEGDASEALKVCRITGHGAEALGLWPNMACIAIKKSRFIWKWPVSCLASRLSPKCWFAVLGCSAGGSRLHNGGR
jgi:hypothetical protein